MVSLTDIHSLTDFQRNAKAYLEPPRLDDPDAVVVRGGNPVPPETSGDGGGTLEAHQKNLTKDLVRTVGV
jgi:hypothetical protein